MITITDAVLDAASQRHAAALAAGVSPRLALLAALECGLRALEDAGQPLVDTPDTTPGPDNPMWAAGYSAGWMDDTYKGAERDRELNTDQAIALSVGCITAAAIATANWPGNTAEDVIVWAHKFEASITAGPTE